ncbi:MAG: hypothetical protein ABL953_02695 [Ilumatobacteraceae bacterium]
MTHSLPLRDRWRIERFVWSVDSRLSDLPRKSRVERRRELRDNLRAAASDIGTTAALQGVGDVRQLAAGYVAAEFGDGNRRPAWEAGLTAFLLCYLVLAWLLEAGTNAFRAGVVAGDPRSTGAFTWKGISYLLDDVTFEFVDGRSTSVGGAWMPLTYAIVFAVVIFAGKLWRLLPVRKRRG